VTQLMESFASILFIGIYIAVAKAEATGDFQGVVELHIKFMLNRTTINGVC